ncbi:MAG: hypothetical protein EOP04_00945 [Proteobacteria bacterium]|nr:MAG: hypothetical protein EOP04_00945 [Pseudomonadota bacterium]
MMSVEQSSTPVKKRSERRRRDATPIKVRVDEVEQSLIAENAGACGLSIPEYLRRLGKGHIPQSKLDQVHVRELCAVAGDLGRIGGLLKLWLAGQRAGIAPIDKVSISDVDALYREIQSISAALKEKVIKL